MKLRQKAKSIKAETGYIIFEGKSRFESVHGSKASKFKSDIEVLNV
jgi:hypothetical protein